MAGPPPGGYYGQLTGYAPVPNAPGYFDFTTASGGTRRMPDTPGARAAMRGIDAANGGTQRGPGPEAPPAEPAAPPAQPTPMFSTPDGGVAMLRPGGNPQDPSAWFKRMPSRAGSKGGMMAQGMTTQGGYEIDPERAREIEETQNEIQSAYSHTAREAGIATAQRQAYFDAARQQASKEAVEMARENTIKTQQVEELRGKYETAERDFLETPDKQKKAREGQTGRTIVEAIASALGAFGAGLARTPNFAAQTIEANRERELRREEAELRVKKEVQDSLLGRLRDEMGSMELAKTAFRAIRSRQDALALEQVAAKTQDAQRQQEILQVAASQNQGYAKWREEWERGADGQVTKTFRYNPGSAGSRGGDVPLSIQEHAGVANIGGTYASTNKTNADAAGAAKGDAPKPVPAERTTQIAEDASLLALGSRILTNPQVQGDSDTFEAKGSIASKVPIFGPAIAPKEFKEYEQDLQNWTNRRIKFLTGAGMAESEAIRIARGEVGENKAVNRVKQGVGSGMEEAASRLKANFATLPPEQQQELFEKLPPNVQQMLKKGGK